MHSIGKHGVVVLGEVNCARDLDEPDPLLLELKDGTSCAVTTVMTLCGDGESSAVIVFVPASCWTARISMRLVDPRMRRGLAYHGASIGSQGSDTCWTMAEDQEPGVPLKNMGAAMTPDGPATRLVGLWCMEERLDQHFGEDKL